MVVLVVPRVLFDAWTGDDFINLLSKVKEKQALANAFTKACKEWNFDGLVLEVWTQLAGRIKYEMLQNLIQQIGNKFTN